MHVQFAELRFDIEYFDCQVMADNPMIRDNKGDRWLIGSGESR
jgi:hypothetical protein